MPHSLTKKIEIQKIQKDIRNISFLCFRQRVNLYTFPFVFNLKQKTYVSYIFLKLLYLPECKYGGGYSSIIAKAAARPAVMRDE